jgi:hypothetical protein
MQSSPSRDPDARLVRYAILNGSPIPADTTARLVARGIDVGALENRVRALIGEAR